MKEIGRGAFAKVRLAIQDETNQHFAIKVFNKGSLKRKKEAFRNKSDNSITNIFYKQRSYTKQHMIKLSVSLK